MRRFKKRITIWSLRLPRLGIQARRALPFLGFTAALTIICSLGAVSALEGLAKWAGGRVFETALTLELGVKKGGESVTGALLSAVFPAFASVKTSQVPLSSAAPAPSTTIKPTATPAPTATPRPTSTPKPTPAPTPAPTPKPTTNLNASGIEIKGDTGAINVAALLNEPLSFKLDGEPEILIIHTHSTESYLCDGSFTEVGTSHTLDQSSSVIRVGEELRKALEDKGYSVIHDKGVYDYPSYTGSYDRSMASISAYLKKYPSIKIVLDIHRDAASDSYGNAVEASALINGETVSRIMLVVGAGSKGLENPHWQENLKLALRLQAAMNLKYSGLARPIEIASDRYNEQASLGSLLIEIGCNGNTLEESLVSARLLADSFSSALGG